MLSFTDRALAARQEKISGFYVGGAILSTTPILDPFSTIGDQAMINQGAAPENLDLRKALHSQALLTAFFMNDEFRRVTEKLPDVVKMSFDELLFANKTETDKLNFLEGLIQHQAGGDGMVDRFTADLQLIAQSGGLTMSSHIDNAPTSITHALIACAMQAYTTPVSS
ncbi:hypothetical protein ACUUL3_13960 [Thiovibrio sp. JS02]